MQPNTDKLPILFCSLPTETQQEILSHLSSRSHHLALSTSCRHLYALSAEHLHSEISFDPLDTDDSVLSYLVHCAPVHGKLCKTLKLGFSLGPMISRAADLMRADLFVRLLHATRESVQILEINPAGTDLKNTRALLKALPTMAFPNLREMKLKVYDLEDDEVATLAGFFNDVARNSANFPALRSISLEGYWELSSSPANSASPAIRALKNCLSNLSNLSYLRLAYLTIPKKDLKSLFQPLQLVKLELEELEPLSWQECLETLEDSPSKQSLRSLKLTLGDMTLSDRQLRKIVELPTLRRLDIDMIRYSPSDSDDKHLNALFASICDERRLRLPRLTVLNINDALAVRVETCVNIACRLGQAKNNGIMSSLLYVLVDAGTPPGCRVAAESLLRPAGIQVRDLPCRDVEQETTKVIYVNKGTIDAGGTSGANDAAFALAESMGATLYQAEQVMEM